jgi:GMP synthase (glutamine-hydrolysing)
MFKVLAIGHVAFEDLGAWEQPLMERGATIDYLDIPRTPLAALEPLESDLLVILGGPIGAYEKDAYPFLEAETNFIARRLAARKPILGLCLGAQLMANAAGARVYPGPAKEIGWSRLDLTEAGKASPLRHLDGPVLHWHGDTFDLPPGATHLASTPLTRHQAYAIGDFALGLQFHPEVTAGGLEAWYVGHACEIAATPGVSVAALRAAARSHAPALEQSARSCLEEWLRGCGL